MKSGLCLSITDRLWSGDCGLTAISDSVQGSHIGQRVLKTAQLKVAIGAPLTPVEGQDNGTPLQRRREGDRPAQRIRKYEIGRDIANLQTDGIPCALNLVDCRLDMLANVLRGSAGDGIELLLE